MSPLKQVMSHTSGQELEGNQLAAMVSDPCLCGSYALISHPISLWVRRLGRRAGQKCPFDPHGEVFLSLLSLMCYRAWLRCMSVPLQLPPLNLLWVFIRLFVTITTCLYQGGQQHGTGWQTEAIPAGKRGIESANGQTHGHFQVKLQESVFPSLILEHPLLPSGHAPPRLPPRHWAKQRETNFPLKVAVHVSTKVV